MWIFALLSLAAACSPDLLTYQFSDCTNNTRSAYFYWKENCTDPVPPPIQGLECQVVCPSGSFLDLDGENKVSTCSLCPAGTYSIGGGWRVAGNEGAWKNLNTSFSTYCYTSSWLDWEMGVDCTPWSSDESGRFVHSGSASNLDSWLESDLITFVHLVQPGNLTLRYKKATKVYNSIRNGAFLVYINGDRVYDDVSPMDETWTEIVLSLERGPSQIMLSYEIFNAKGFESMRATIDSMEIVGTEYSAYECIPCKTGYSNSGASACDMCPANFYLTIENGFGTCNMCPLDKYAPVGSVGADACQTRKPCTVHDYYPVYSVCQNDTMTLDYQWIFPSICNAETGVQLPESQTGLQCGLCSPGMYHKDQSNEESVCSLCPGGTALTETVPTAACDKCLAGFYGAQVLNYSSFNAIPRLMSTYCLANNETCALSDGWIPSEVALSTVCPMQGIMVDPGAVITLLTTVVVKDLDAFVQFSYSLHDLGSTGSKLTFYIDDQVIAVFDSDTIPRVSDRFNLTLDSHVLKWTFTHMTNETLQDDGGYLYWIAILGTREGGAPVCQRCPKGSISKDGEASCKFCPVGMTSDVNSISCIPCDWFAFNDVEGNRNGCLPCPDFSMANADHTACVGKANITGAYEYGLKEFTSLSDRGMPLLCDKSKYRHRCQDSFFGPVTHNNSYFFLSVANPSSFRHSSYSRFDQYVSGYAFGIIDKKDLPVKKSDLNKPDEVCADDFNKMIVNLGTRLHTIEESEGGFNVGYSQGGVCDNQTNSRFESIIHFHCEKLAGDGWPQYLYTSGCVYHFAWDSQLACHTCKQSELRYIKGKCMDGHRYSFYEEGEMCKYSGAGLILDVEECSETTDAIKTWPIVLGSVAAGFLVLVVFVLLCSYCRVKAKYHRLVEYKEEPIRGSPGIEVANIAL